MNRTFTMIKPKAVKKGYTFKILDNIHDAGFKVLALKKTKLTKEDAKKFYAVHKERPFFKDLVKFMSSGPIYVAILKKKNAVNDFRKLIGNTDPRKASGDTIRANFGKDIQANAVHGSDRDENALIESSFFFSKREIHK